VAREIRERSEFRPVLKIVNLAILMDEFRKQSSKGKN
jgi:hypothetical protein